LRNQGILKEEKGELVMMGHAVDVMDMYAQMENVAANMDGGMLALHALELKTDFD
jgi:hypothetical protein